MTADIHAHILPGMDDGSGSVEESIAMLRASADQGVTHIAATPHFYPEEETPERFLCRRAESVATLRHGWTEGLPKLLLGAEVAWFEGMSRPCLLDGLCLEETGILLVEMPYAPWTERMLRELRELKRAGKAVLLAHIERYLPLQRSGVWEELLNQGILFQCNAAFFLSRRTRRRALRMLRRGYVHMLGSDCHDMLRRPPNLGDALRTLDGRDRAALEETAGSLLSAAAAGR